jgi:hypothetical protein
MCLTNIGPVPFSDPNSRYDKETGHGLVNGSASGQAAWNAWIAQRLAMFTKDPNDLNLDQPP